MLGQTLGHYRILEKIGAGGMGEVYRAHDERLDRDVALKVLPAGLLADETARHRFRKEALALAKLNHPNIEAVHDFDSQAGVDFLVMEYVPGVTLSDKLAQGPLSEKELVRYGQQLAEGLAAAHEKGVIHRDLKPGNLRITTDGRLKILDFGLAKLVRPVADQDVTTSLTETKLVSGTLPYMAPEQLRGEPVDARTDLYAAGVVLYEMATGRRPFEHQLSTALADEIQHKPAPPPGRLKTDLSVRLEEIILKCLEKESENRYQSAKELLVDLRRLASPTTELSPRQVPDVPKLREEGGPRGWGLSRRVAMVLGMVLVLAVVTLAGYFLKQRLWPVAKPPSGKIMLAVLPVDNLSGDPEQEYFSDGLTEEMIAQLGRLQPQRLGVIARTSAMRYKHTDKAIDQIGRELGVGYVLESSVRRDANRVRITAQLIQVRDQTHLWAESYEREMAGIFTIQSEVAQRVADSLAIELLPDQQARLAKAHSVNSEALEAYLKGRFYWNRRDEEGLKKGLDYFQKAIAADPSYAQAYAGVADSYSIMGNYFYLPPNAAYPKAREAARKALDLDESLAEAHTSLGIIKRDYDWDWSGAETEFKRAIELDPGYATGHQLYAFLLSSLARHNEAIAQIEQARQLDPRSAVILRNVGLMLYRAGRYEDALASLKGALDLFPDDPWSHGYLGDIYVAKGDFDRAIQEFRKEEALEGSPRQLGNLGYVYAITGKKTEALKVLRELEERSRSGFPSDYGRAMVYMGLGEKDQTLHWLEKAFQNRNPSMATVNVEPKLAPLRSDPRFQDLLRRMNFPP